MPHLVILLRWPSRTIHLEQLLNLLLQLCHLLIFGVLLDEHPLVAHLLVLESRQSILQHADLTKDFFVHLVCLGLLFLECLYFKDSWLIIRVLVR